MRNLLALIGLVVVLFAGLGWYRGWYSFELQRGSDGKLLIDGAVDVNKIGSDGQQGLNTVGKVIQGTTAPTDPTAPGEVHGPPAPADLRVPPTQVQYGPFKVSVPTPGATLPTKRN